ncbi:hypothetical protein AB5I41_15990 [Sphingomonas sp. MMS24-JH45]
MTAPAPVPEALPRVRRVVTAIDAEGQSYIAEAGPSPAGFALPGSPFRSDNIWRTAAAPAPVEADDDIQAHRGVLPPPGGSAPRASSTFRRRRARRRSRPRSPPRSSPRSIRMPIITSAARGRRACTPPTRSTTPSCSRARSGR